MGDSFIRFMDKIWRIAAGVLSDNKTLSFVEWDDKVSLYNGGTGETHLLNLFPFEVLLTLLPGHATITSISMRMAELCGEYDNQQWRSNILKILMQLEELELVDCQ